MHEIESKSIRYTLSTFGLAASLMLLVASAWANFRYGYKLGATPQDGMVWGIAAAASDVLMAGSPFFFFAAVRGRSWTQALAAAAVWFITTAFALQSALGHATTNRMDVVSKRQGVTTTYGDVRSDIKDARQKLGFIPEARPEATVRAEIEKHKVHRFWVGSSECTEIAGKAQREYCGTYQTLNAELGNSMERAKQEARIALLTEKSDKLVTENPGATSEADPGAQTVANMTGWDVRTTQGILGLVAVLMLLIGAGLGPYASMAMLGFVARKDNIIDAEVIEAPKAPDPEPQIALAAKPTTKALPPPEKQRGEPSAEARLLLEAIAFPRTRLKGVLRPKESPKTSALRFLAYLHAHNLTGEHTAEEFDDLFRQFCNADHREEPGTRVVKPELERLRQFITKGAPVAGKKPTTWTVREQPLDKVRALLLKEKIITAEPEPKPPGKKPQEAGEGTVIPFSNASGAVPDKAAPGDAPVAKSALKGLAQLNRYMPDMAGMQALVRAQKKDWQQRFASRDRKQVNRLRMSRSA